MANPESLLERRSDPLLPRSAFIRRLAVHSFLALGLVIGALGIGALGYHFLAGLPWVDSVLNASMILGGMGPVDPLTTTPAKLFASAYALFCGVVFLAVVGILFAPLIHRLLHHFHLETDDESS